MHFPKILRTSVLGLTLLLVAGCESTEDKAERLYQRAVELAEADDIARAYVSLKSVFRLDGQHLQARMLYADLKQEDGALEEAYRHYLLVAEQYPDYAPVRLHLSRIALDLGAWDEVERHAAAAAELGETAPELRAIELSLAYRAALRDEDPAAAKSAVSDARAFLELHPSLNDARRIVIDDHIAEGRVEAALAGLDTALAQEPEEPALNRLKLTLLARTGDMSAMGDHLRVMVERFPDDREIRSALVRWYLAGDDPDGAEDFVRELVARSGEEIPPRVALVQFLRQVRGPEAAIEELDALIAEGLDDILFETMRASLVFDQGRRQPAIERLSSLLDETEPSDARRDMQITLARMHLAEDREAAARELVGSVLEEDGGHVEALKLQARWLIAEDRVRDAVLSLRTAMDQSPRDAGVLTLLAMAYERDGARELMGESLALAYDYSNAAPAETLRYAEFLIGRDKWRTAEEILLRSLRLAPNDLALLQTLGEVYLALGDWPRTEQVIAAVEAQESERAGLVAAGLQATLLQRMERSDESLELLRNVIAERDAGIAAQAAIIRTHLAEGDIGAARAFMNELLAETEGAPSRGLRFLDAALLTVEGRLDAAEDVYLGILDEDPRQPVVWRALVAAKSRAGEAREAEALVDRALGHLPEAPTLLWIKAGFLERRGDVDGAIGIYERLYETDSSSVIVANNLASLLSSHRDDEAALERAYVIARRLRGTTIPAFQDTYGWIAFRLGNLNEALGYLEPAAEGLPNDPAVQYHLAETYAALGRGSDALARYRQAIALWDGTGGEAPAQAVKAAAQIDRLGAGAPAADGDPAERPERN